ncbi:MAG: PLP-dependent aminotransferase family protein [Oscillospiraceae bacterium]|nr:PLP-dependent aminotransferase family protein [Oscillospiraceae bacterium]
MEYKFSDRIAGLKPSAVREILKSTSDPDVISFAAGNPAPESFPIEAIRHVAAEILDEQPITALQYGITEGYAPLIEKLRVILKKRDDIGTEDDGIIVTSGATQVMELLTKVLCNEGDKIVCENPSFIGSLNCFRSYGCDLVGIPIESDGIDVDALEAALKADTDHKIKFLYTIANFQNPGGVTMSLEKRRRVYELACKYDIIILEDNPYGTIRVTGEDVPAIKTMDTEGRVVYAGTFSKIISPGIRVGYVVGPKPVLAKMTVGKQTEDVHTAMFNQMLVYRWLNEYDLESHLKKNQGIYRKKLSLMCDLIDSELGDAVTYVRPEGGLFIWCRLNDKLDMMTFVQKAMEKKVAVVPGTAFLTDQSQKTQYIRVNFSTPTDEEIVAGMKRLGETAREMMA